MTTNPSTEGRPAAGSSGMLGTEFRKLYVTGVVGWAIGMLALLGAAWIFSKPETVPIAMLWMISHCWIAFLIGLALMVVRAVASKASVAKPLQAYVLPVAVLSVIAGICLAIYPDAGFKSDLLTYLPVVLVFYGFGCLWLALGGLDGGAFLRAVVPSIVGGLIILGFVAVPAFASDSFRYRAAFQLSTNDTKIENGKLVFDGDLKIMKAGNYAFSAPRYIWTDTADDAGGGDVELGEIQWGQAGAPKEGAIGKFPLRIVWKKGVPQVESGQLPPYEDGVMLEVSRPDQGGKVVYYINVNPGEAP